MRKINLLLFISILLVLGSCKNQTDPVEETYEIDTRYTDALILESSYEGKGFVADGIGEVDLVRCVDGDTAVFSSEGQSYSVRFLGINTPESTGKIEPWGRPASAFTCDKLTNAETIVLESDPGKERMDSTGTRYLGWVWYDGRLLNLEIIEEGYSPVGGLSGTKYVDTFYDADLKTQKTQQRFWGEEDPTYDYSGTVYNISIEELKTNYDEYEGRKIKISGVVSRKVGNHFYLEENGYGIFVYCSYNATPHILEGQELLLVGSPAKYQDVIQVTSVDLRDGVDIIGEGEAVEPKLLSLADLDTIYEGDLVRINGLEVVSVYENQDNDAYTVTVKDSSGTQITIRHDGITYPEVDSSLFVVGQTLDIIGPLSKYQNSYQVMVTKNSDIIN